MAFLLAFASSRQICKNGLDASSYTLDAGIRSRMLPSDAGEHVLT